MSIQSISHLTLRGHYKGLAEQFEKLWITDGMLKAI